MELNIEMIIIKYLNKFRVILLGFLVLASCQDEDKIYKIPDPISGGAVRATVVPENSLLDGKNFSGAGGQGDRCPGGAVGRSAGADRKPR